MSGKDEITRICLWSGPRNISTTMMYSFAQRKDTLVFDEPLYAHYLCNTPADSYHPGASEVIESQENKGEKVIEMMLGNHKKPIVFFKNMTHHLLGLDRSFMKNVINVILTRDPIEMLPSFAKVIENPTMDDVGYDKQAELITYLKKENCNYIVLDSKRVLLNPKKILLQCCDLMGIPFDEQMLHWNLGPRPEDGVWAKYWYHNIHHSKGYKKYQAKEEPFPEKLQPLLEACQLHYSKIVAGALIH